MFSIDCWWLSGVLPETAHFCFFVALSPRTEVGSFYFLYTNYVSLIQTLVWWIKNGRIWRPYCEFKRFNCSVIWHFECVGNIAVKMHISNVQNGKYSFYVPGQVNWMHLFITVSWTANVSLIHVCRRRISK
jgi:hypothetical protein